MTPEDFKHALSIGLGRVIQFLKTHDATPYRDIIHQACLHSTVYDMQFNGTRSQYFFEIINLTDEKDYYLAAILSALKVVDAERYDLEHLFYLAGEFAKAGDSQARQVMIERMNSELTNHDWVAYAMIDQLGIDGFLHVIDLRGQSVLNEGEYTDGDYLPKHLAGREPPISPETIETALNEARANNPRVEAYLGGLEEYQAKLASRKRPEHGNELRGMDYEEVRELVENYIATYGKKYPRIRLYTWARHTSETQLLAAAKDFLKEDDTTKLSSYVWIFRKVPFPLDIEKLIKLAEHHHEELAIGSITALKNFSDPLVRELALNMIKDQRRLEAAVGLLRKNFQPEDWTLIEKLTSQKLDAETYHSMGFDIKDIFEERQDLAGVPALLNLYNYLPCGMCREGVVELLHSVGQLPDEIREECQYDGHIDLRNKARANFQ